ncbi:MFS general substrate transporter [Thozetella sp. PMI_491]|nr:MFS general substrate transporter [Thozetella sp. PMI_491]
MSKQQTTSTNKASDDHQTSASEQEPDPDLITWYGPDDKDNPQNWSLARKFLITGIWVYGNLVTCIASSIFSSGGGLIASEFQVSPTVVALGMSLFLLGYAVGPPIWGPMSERFGRRWPMLIGMALFTIFCVPVAVGRNIETLLIGRFLTGVFGVAPPSLAGGGMVDIWNPVQRGIALASCIGTIFGSPILAPLMGNFIAASPLGWRWTQWLSCIMSGSCTVVVFLLLPEIFAPAILQARAKSLRKSGSNPNARTVFDSRQKVDFLAVAQSYLFRPFVLLATEPILDLITVYQAFIYGILYLVFVSYPIAFREVRHWALGVSALPYLGMLVGVILGALTVVWYTKTRFMDLVRRNGGKVVPEQRLPVMICGGCLLPVGLFIFAWTSRPDIHWIGMVLGSVLVGMGMYMVFVQCLTYLVDVFFGAAFPLFGPYMYHNLGVAWATSVLGFISIAMLPIPFLFYWYGSRIRSWSTNRVTE